MSFSVTLLSASEDVVGSAVSMSMGFLAGSTMMSLTIIWGSVIAFGSYDLQQTPSSNLENKTPCLSNGLFFFFSFFLSQYAKIFSNSVK